MNFDELNEKVKKGKIFIYPTDTIYGLGCDAFNNLSVKRIKEIKGRDRDKPLSIIAPSFEWIEDNLIVDVDLKKYLPGAYTIVLKKKDRNFLSSVSGGDSLGIRIPNNDFCDRIRKIGIPFVTTSVNFSGESPVNKIEDVSEEIKKKVDVVVDGGVLKGKASTLVIGGREVSR